MVAAAVVEFAQAGAYFQRLRQLPDAALARLRISGAELSAHLKYCADQNALAKAALASAEEADKARLVRPSRPAALRGPLFRHGCVSRVDSAVSARALGGAYIYVQISTDCVFCGGAQLVREQDADRGRSCRVQEREAQRDSIRAYQDQQEATARRLAEAQARIAEEKRAEAAHVARQRAREKNEHWQARQEVRDLLSALRLCAGLVTSAWRRERPSCIAAGSCQACDLRLAASEAGWPRLSPQPCLAVRNLRETDAVLFKPLV